MEATLAAKPRMMDDGQVGSMLQAYIDSEHVKASESVLDVGGWGEPDKRRVGLVLQTMRERVSPPPISPGSVLVSAQAMKLIVPVRLFCLSSTIRLSTSSLGPSCWSCSPPGPSLPF